LQRVDITHINFAKGFRGGERQTLLLIEELAKKGYTQRFLMRKGNDYLLKKVQEIPYVEVIEISKPYIFSLQYAKNTKLLHAHETKALQFAFFAHLFYNVPYIVTRRVDNAVKENLFNKLLYKNAAYCVALSRAIAKTIPSKNIVIIPSAATNLELNEKNAQKIKKRFEKKFLVGCIAALDNNHKGQSYLIDAVKQLHKKGLNVALLFVGSGQDEEYLRSLAKGCEYIEFAGFVENVPDYIAAFDLFAFPSLNEGLGSVLFDAMRLGIAIVASNVGGIPDIIKDQSNGILVPPKDSKALADAIEMLYYEEEKRKVLAQQAKKDAVEFTPVKMAQKYEKLYIELLKER